jgi:N-acetylglucosaminyl-diphospho-decaprenol L-rhamnosyltransferase
VAHVLQPHSANVESAVLIIIVNYRTASLVADCLSSLEPEIADLPSGRVIVVDGGSNDASAESIARVIFERGYGSWAQLLALEENRGFAAANNAALRGELRGPARPDFVYLLNPDTVIRSGAVRALVSFMRAHPEAGIAGSRNENPDGTPRQTAFRFPSALGEFESEAGFSVVTRFLSRAQIALPVQDTPHRADWVCGAAMMVRSTVFERIGLLDEQFFLYYEETDLALRAARAGFETWYVPASRIVHYCGQSSGITGSRADATRVPRYWYASRKHYFEKHHGPTYGWLADAAWLTGSITRRCRRALLQRPAHAPPHQLRDFVRFSAQHWMTP